MHACPLPIRGLPSAAAGVIVHAAVRVTPRLAMCAQVLAIQQQQAALAAAQQHQQHSMPMDPAQMHHMHAEQVWMPLRLLWLEPPLCLMDIPALLLVLLHSRCRCLRRSNAYMLCGQSERLHEGAELRWRLLHLNFAVLQHQAGQEQQQNMDVQGQQVPGAHPHQVTIHACCSSLCWGIWQDFAHLPSLGARA